MEQSSYSYKDQQAYSSPCWSQPYTRGIADRSQSSSPDLVTLITGQKLRFDYLSLDTIKKLLYERERIRAKNHAGIIGELNDVSGEIGCCENLRYDPEARRRQLRLESLKSDLEHQLREEDTTLWRDTVELRRELVLAAKQYDSTRLRNDLVGSVPPGPLPEEHRTGVNDFTYSADRAVHSEYELDPGLLRRVLLTLQNDNKGQSDTTLSG